jgi:predicted DNA-binding antitoxin AbrB/MazE fold protein
MTVKAIYSRGVFRPVQAVDLPENSEVQIVLRGDSATDAPVDRAREQARLDVAEILSRRYRSGQTDTAARHNEHQP